MAVDRFEVAAADGATLAVWDRGQGTAIVLVHGSLRDHRSLDDLAARLSQRHRTFAIDRRGYGASRDGGAYAIEREFDDVAAVVAAVALRHGTPVALFGHSYGAGVAIGAAARTPHVHRLVIYEPGLGIRYPTGWIDAQEQALAAGRVDDVVTAVLTDVLGMSATDVQARRAAPRWDEYRAAAPILLREARAEDTWSYDRDMVAGIQAPTLLLVGTETAEALARASDEAAMAISGARIHRLGGHGHLAHQVDPGLVAGTITSFVES